MAKVYVIQLRMFELVTKQVKKTLNNYRDLLRINRNQNFMASLLIKGGSLESFSGHFVLLLNHPLCIQTVKAAILKESTLFLTLSVNT